jgi:transposase
VEEISRDAGMLGDTLRALLAVLRKLGEQVALLDRRASKFGKHNAACRHLTTVPGVGTLTAIAFVTAVSVGAYLGLTPRRYQSGEKDVVGRISRCGDPLVRSYLYEAANVLLTRVGRWVGPQIMGRAARQAGGHEQSQSCGRPQACGHSASMWMTGEEFHWSNTAPVEAAA